MSDPLLKDGTTAAPGLLQGGSRVGLPSAMLAAPGVPSGPPPMAVMMLRCPTATLEQHLASGSKTCMIKYSAKIFLRIITLSCHLVRMTVTFDSYFLRGFDDNTWHQNGYVAGISPVDYETGCFLCMMCTGARCDGLQDEHGDGGNITCFPSALLLGDCSEWAIMHPLLHRFLY